MTETPDLSAIDQQLRERAREAVAFQLIAPNDNIEEKSLNYFGGDPTLAAGLSWPRIDVNSERLNVPLTFLGQIDCSTLPNFDGRATLPQAGILHFFEYTDDRDNIKGKILFSPAKSALLEQKPPADTPPVGYPYAETRHNLRTGSRPSGGLRVGTTTNADGYKFPISYSRHEVKAFVLQTLAYWEFCPLSHDRASAIAAKPYNERLRVLTKENYAAAFGPEPARLPGVAIRKTDKYSIYAWQKESALNQMLGFPCDTYGRTPAADDVLLMQFRTDVDAVGCSFGDCDELQFWIKRDDLSAGRFDAAWTRTIYG